MDAYVRRFCEVKRPRDVLQFLESFVYVWPWALAALFALYRLGADYLPSSLVIAVPGLALAEAARLHSSTYSPYATDYHLLEALKVVALTIGVVVVAGPSAVVLSDCVDRFVLDWTPSFLAGQALAAKLGLCAGGLAYLIQTYIADASHDVVQRPKAPPRSAIPALDLNNPADSSSSNGGGGGGGGGGGAIARLAKLQLKARALVGYLHDVRDSIEHRRRGGPLGEATHDLIADVAPVIILTFLLCRSVGSFYGAWLDSAGVAVDPSGSIMPID